MDLNYILMGVDPRGQVDNSSCFWFKSDNSWIKVFFCLSGLVRKIMRLYLEFLGFVWDLKPQTVCVLTCLTSRVGIISKPRCWVSAF